MTALEILNMDLANEQRDMLFFLAHSGVAGALGHSDLASFILKQARDEFEHVISFQGAMSAFQGTHGTMKCMAALHAEPAPFPRLTDPKEIMDYAIQMEQEAIDNYDRQIHEAQTSTELRPSEASALATFLTFQRTESANRQAMLRAKVSRMDSPP